MFTGIVSHTGIVKNILKPNDWELSIDIIDNDISKKNFNVELLSIGASISCSGICLTLKKVFDNHKCKQYLLLDMDNLDYF